MIHYIEVKSKTRTELIDITPEIIEMVRKTAVKDGVCHLFTLHTTAGITINEGADPAVRSDICRFLEKQVPNAPWFTHSEGNSDSHIKSMLTGTSQSIFIENGKLLLGTWQSVFFCEFDGPRTRRIAVKIAAEN